LLSLFFEFVIITSMLNNDKKQDKNWIDVTAPGKKPERGHLHPLTLVQRKVAEVFSSMGFEIAEGPEMESEWYNFDALNVPKDHPARDMQDTFWLKNNQQFPISKFQFPNKSKTRNSKKKDGEEENEKFVLRTHTSNVQIHYMETHQPPIRIVAPGRVFRYEATDATHEAQFYQLEGLMVDIDITLANLKGVLEIFFQKFFGDENIKVRLRPSYFPFVEPGVEFDMKYKGKWMEIGGAGMVHPNVLKNAGLDPRNLQGFAFGMGLERLAMIKYKIDDIRLFYSGDLRFLKQF